MTEYSRGSALRVASSRSIDAAYSMPTSIQATSNVETATLIAAGTSSWWPRCQPLRTAARASPLRAAMMHIVEIAMLGKVP